jgi:hypothetical protein
MTKTSRHRIAVGARLVISALAFALGHVAAAATPVYQSRFADAPPARVGQASRGEGADVQLVVLAPDRKGASAQPSPRLCWFLSAPSERSLEVVVQERGADQPLLERRLETGAGGFQSIDLRELGIVLEPGKEYEWSVALIVDPAKRASDLFSKGVVQYVPPDGPLPAGSPESIVSQYLAQGYWYDAIALMQQTLIAEPGRSEMVTQRQQVLEAEQLLTQR